MMEATYNIGNNDVDVFRMYDQYIYKVIIFLFYLGPRLCGSRVVREQLDLGFCPIYISFFLTNYLCYCNKSSIEIQRLGRFLMSNQITLISFKKN